MTITAPKCKLCGQQHWGPLCARMAAVKEKTRSKSHRPRIARHKVAAAKHKG